jgi:hypothetical protein
LSTTGGAIAGVTVIEWLTVWWSRVAETVAVPGVVEVKLDVALLD